MKRVFSNAEGLNIKLLVLQLERYRDLLLDLMGFNDGYMYDEDELIDEYQRVDETITYLWSAQVDYDILIGGRNDYI